MRALVRESDTETPQERVRAGFAARFGGEPELVVRAPGRVNLIGEHTDYNDGFVLPMALERAVWIALRPSGGDTVTLHSLDFDETRAFSLAALGEPDEPDEVREASWVEYPRGVAWALRDAGRPTRGWEGVVAGDVPLGAGLSSSAALEVATARAFVALAGDEWEAEAMARLAQRAERRWVGVDCGIMDPLASAAGRAGAALLIDCRSLAVEPIALPEGVVVAVLDTGTRRTLVDSDYNERRRVCEQAARRLGVPALRDLDANGFASAKQELSAAMLRRVRHVVSENARTLEAADALRAGDAVGFGRCMDASHVSLRDDFEVSSPALDAMVGCAGRAPGALGARMTGAGFGGCAVALVEEAAAVDFARELERGYREATGRAASVGLGRPAGGACVVSGSSGAGSGG